MLAIERGGAHSRSMSRWLLSLVLCAACGDNLHPVADAAAPDVPTGPDAPVCATGEETCDGTCIPVTDDEANCGGCMNVCHGGEVCTSSTCQCPVGVVPPIVFPTGFEQFFNVGVFTLTLAPTISLSGFNGLVFGHDANIPLDTDIDLSTVPLGSTPFVAALAGLDLTTFQIDASYVATAGTINFSKRCDTEIEGTLKNATFSGVAGGIVDGSIPTLDPDGCVIEVPTLSFHLMTSPCQ